MEKLSSDRDFNNKLKRLHIQLSATQFAFVDTLSHLIEINKTQIGGVPLTDVPDTKQIASYFADQLALSYSNLCGVDLFSNMSSGKVIISKYSRDGSVKRWNVKKEHSIEADSPETTTDT